MKKTISLIICTLLMLTVFTACSQNNETGSSGGSSDAKSNAPSAETSGATDKTETGNSKVLIVYYSLTGTAENLANIVKEKTGGDIYLLTPETPYNTDHDAAIAEVDEERASGTLRGLKGTLPDISAYDYILIGGPVWRRQPSNPVQKYLSLTDFGGAKVSGFWVANSNPGTYAELFKDMAKNAEVLDGLSLINEDVQDSDALESKIDTWLNTLGL